MKDRKPLPPTKQLENLFDSLADDVAEGYIKPDKKTSERAGRIARKAIEQASDSHDKSEQEWTKRSERQEAPDKGPAK